MIKLNFERGSALNRELHIDSAGRFFVREIESETEMLVHDVAHAMSLGISVGPYFNEAIDNVLYDVARLGSDVRNESYVLAAEYCIYLQTASPILLRSLYKEARAQDVSRKLLQHALASSRAKEVARKTYNWLRRNKVASGSFASRSA
jgi:hypothetical protein